MWQRLINSHCCAPLHRPLAQNCSFFWTDDRKLSVANGCWRLFTYTISFLINFFPNSTSLTVEWYSPRRYPISTNGRRTLVSRTVDTLSATTSRKWALQICIELFLKRFINYEKNLAEELHHTLAPVARSISSIGILIPSHPRCSPFLPALVILLSFRSNFSLIHSFLYRSLPL